MVDHSSDQVEITGHRLETMRKDLISEDERSQPLQPRLSGTSMCSSSTSVSWGPAPKQTYDPSLSQRLLDRDGPFQQSKGYFRVSRLGESLWNVRKMDHFHTITAMSTWKVLLMFWAAYVCSFFFFAIFYYVLDDRCGLKIISFLDALYLSLETQMTIGYGIPNVYFKRHHEEEYGCPQGIWVLMSQSLLSLGMNAMLIGILYQRCSRGTTRSSTVLFSDKACITEVRGALYFNFQVCDVRKHQLMEVHVRCYALRHDARSISESEQQGSIAGNSKVGQPIFFQQSPLRLQQPDDSLGGTLLLCVPSLVVHRIDAWSPLARSTLSPFDTWREDPSPGRSFPDVQQRVVDKEIAGTDGDVRAWKPQRADIEKVMKREWLEVLVLVEGVEPLTSSTIQARHSYLFARDVAWDKTFAPCVYRDEAGGCCVDFDKFHDLQDAPASSELLACSG